MKKFWNEQTTFVKLAIVLIGFAFFIYLTATIFKPVIEGMFFWNTTDYEKSGQIGDFVAGVVGTLFAFAGTIFIILTFREQMIENKRNRFEEIYYEMVRIHRENVSQLVYNKKNKKSISQLENRQVIKEIVDEFKEVYGEIKKLMKRWDVENSLTNSYINRTTNIIEENKLDTTVYEMFIIDLAYFVLFYGIGQEGKVIVKGHFRKDIDLEVLKIILFYLEQKPKKSNKKRYKSWKQLVSLESERLLNTVLGSFDKIDNEEIYDIEIAEKLKLNRLAKSKYKKYYGGHQHRLGHYYRHLYQSYKLLDRSTLITANDKYDYSKLIRAQISTYEQILLFLNSLSSLGRKWQLTSDNDKRNDFIETYQVIKNVPGVQLYDIKYKKFYPKIVYETNEE
jgi:hypothetical protein